MSDRSPNADPPQVLAAPNETRRFFIALARAYGGAIIFALPLLMTMEMWYLGFYMDRLKLMLLILLTLPLLVGLSYYSGFEDTFSVKEDLVDALVAIAVGATASAAILMTFGVLTGSMSPEEWIGKIALQTVPASIGALLAQSQFGPDRQNRESPRQSYWSGLFIMALGALFLAWNVAPTEEIMRIAHRIDAGRGLLILLLSLVIIHAFMFAMEFSGQPDIPEGTTAWGLFARETLVGYAIALLLSTYVLWTFGRLAGLSTTAAVLAIVVLAFPAAVGAAAARLIL